MTTIDPARHCVTLINVFTVTPENQKDLVALLVEATEQTMRHQPGFVSATIHRSLDGTKVANYAQWHSAADFEAMQKNPVAASHMQRAARLATKFEPALYIVEETSAAVPGA